MTETNPKLKRRARRRAGRDDHKVSRYTASERQIQRQKRLDEMKRARRDYLADRHAARASDGACAAGSAAWREAG